MTHSDLKVFFTFHTRSLALLKPNLTETQKSSDEWHLTPNGGSDSRNKFEDLIQMTKNSEQGMEFLYSSFIQPYRTSPKDHSLVAKFYMKSRYIHQMISV
jgi:hypothetical protein